MTIHKFLKSIAFFATPIILVLIFVNYFGDAANLFKSSIEKRIAMAILKGQNVTNISNFDERLFQKEIISSFKRAPDLIVLGSSRTMQLRKKYFGRTSFFNHSVSGATLEDYLAIIQLYEDAGLSLKEVIICLDPWTLNDSHSQIRWKTLSEELNRFSTKGNNVNAEQNHSFKVINYSKLQQLVSLSYFQASFKSLIRDKNSFDTVGNFENARLTRISDGSLVYGEGIRNIAINEIEEDAKTFINGRLYSLELFYDLSPKYLEYLNKLIVYMKRKDIKLNFLMLPYHPIVYDYILRTEKYKKVLEAEDYFNTLARSQGVNIYGSYDPDKLYLKSEHFFDGMHCNERGIDEIASRYFSHYNSFLNSSYQKK